MTDVRFQSHSVSASRDFHRGLRDLIANKQVGRCAACMTAAAVVQQAARPAVRGSARDVDGRLKDLGPDVDKPRREPHHRLGRHRRLQRHRVQHLSGETSKASNSLELLVLPIVRGHRIEPSGAFLIAPC